VVLFFSIHYLIVSTLTLPFIREQFGIRFVGALLVAIPLTLVSTLVVLRYGRRREEGAPSGNGSSSKITFFLVLFLFSLVLLLSKILWKTALTFDEPHHLDITRIVAEFNVSEIRERVLNLPNPPLPYLIMASVLRPFGLSVFFGRVASSVISSIIPVIVYYWARRMGGSFLVALGTAIGYVLTPLYQNVMYLYTFDGISTLFFTLSLLYFLEALRGKKPNSLMMSAVFWVLCALTKYPPALWLLVAYPTVTFFQIIRSRWRVTYFLPFCLVVAPAALLIVTFLPKMILVPLVAILRWSPPDYEHATVLAWDLALVLGWSPYLVNAFKLYEFLTNRESPSDLLVLTLISMAFLTPLVNPITRRVVQVIPIYHISTIEYARTHYRNWTTLLVWLNLFWWGILTI